MSTSNMTPEKRYRLRIYNILKQLELLPKVTVTQDKDTQKIWVTHPMQYVRDYYVEWSDYKNHFRVYDHAVANGTESNQKRQAGYALCAIASTLDAMDFVNTYRFLYRCRANDRSKPVSIIE